MGNQEKDTGCTGKEEQVYENLRYAAQVSFKIKPEEEQGQGDKDQWHARRLPQGSRQVNHLGASLWPGTGLTPGGTSGTLKYLSSST